MLKIYICMLIPNSEFYFWIVNVNKPHVELLCFLLCNYDNFKHFEPAEDKSKMNWYFVAMERATGNEEHLLKHVQDDMIISHKTRFCFVLIYWEF